MGTVDNPDVYVQYHTGVTWQNIIQDCKFFDIEDAGILKIPSCKITLFNPSNIPDFYDLVRIFADVRGENDMIFYGRLYKHLDRTLLGTTGKQVLLDLHCRGIGQRLINDTITNPYYDQQQASDPNTRWTFKEVIEDFLAIPDSLYATNITLEHDSGDILDAVNGACNFDQQTLLDALRVICETIDYDGYIYIDGETAKLKIWDIVSNPQAASPAVTLNHPYTHIDQNYDSDDVKNIIYVFGGVDIGTPAHDKWTELAMSKYDPDIWEGLSGETITDEGSEVKINEYSIKSTKGTGNFDVRLRIDRTEEGTLDLDTKIFQIVFWLHPEAGTSKPMPVDVKIELTDTSDNKIALGQFAVYKAYGRTVIKKHPQTMIMANTNEWNEIRVPTPANQNQEIMPSFHPSLWYLIGGSTTFDASQVKYCDIKVQDEDNDKVPSQDFIWIDGLVFGGGYEINPFKNPSLYPSPADAYGRILDATSINNYGVRTYSHEDRDITSFQQAVDEGVRLLKMLKDATRIVTATKKGYTWVKPHQTLTLNASEYGITSQTWRANELRRTWSTEKKIVYTTFSLIPSGAVTKPAFPPRVGDKPSGFPPFRLPPFIR